MVRSDFFNWQHIKIYDDNNRVYFFCGATPWGSGKDDGLLWGLTRGFEVMNIKVTRTMSMIPSFPVYPLYILSGYLWVSKIDRYLLWILVEIQRNCRFSQPKWRKNFQLLNYTMLTKTIENYAFPSLNNRILLIYKKLKIIDCVLFFMHYLIYVLYKKSGY